LKKAIKIIHFDLFITKKHFYAVFFGKSDVIYQLC